MYFNVNTFIITYCPPPSHISVDLLISVLCTYRKSEAQHHHNSPARIHPLKYTYTYIYIHMNQIAHIPLT